MASASQNSNQNLPSGEGSLNTSNNDSVVAPAPLQSQAAPEPLNESVLSALSDASNKQEENHKCNRCDRALRQFEDSVKCSESGCDIVFHRRCVLPYSTNESLDEKWKCDQCELRIFEAGVLRVKANDNVTFKQRASPRPVHDDTYQYRFKDGRTHICKNPNCPQIRSYTKVKSSPAINDFVVDSNVTKSTVFITPPVEVESRRKYNTDNVVEYKLTKVVDNPVVTTSGHEYVVQDTVNTSYKTYSYIEPQVDYVPAHVERVEITEIAQGIDDRIQLRYKEPVVELRTRAVPVEPAVEKREVLTYAVVDESQVEDSSQYFYYATDEDRRYVEADCKHQCRVHQPALYYKYEKSPKVTHKSTVSYDIPLTVQVPSKKISTSKQIQVSQEVDLAKYYLMEKQLNEQASRLKSQEEKIDELKHYLRRYEEPKVNTSTNTSTSDILSIARDESIKEGNDWRTSLIDEVTKITEKYPTFEEVSPAVVVENKGIPALSILIDSLKDEGKKLLVEEKSVVDKAKSSVVLLAKAPEEVVVVKPSLDDLVNKPKATVQVNVPKINAEINGYDSLTSKKGRDIARSEVNLKFEDSYDGKNTISSRISDRFVSDSYRSGSLERSSSALATVYDGNRSKDGIYEYVRPLAANAIPKASYKGYLERIRFDKILFITEKLYCVLDGNLMHVYKKPTDRRQSKSYKLAGNYLTL